MLLKKIAKFVFSAFFILVFGSAAGTGSALFAQQASDSQKIVYTEKQNSMRITVNDIKLIEDKNDDGEIMGYHLYIRKIKGV